MLCPNTSSFYFHGNHLAADTPTSQTAPIRWCPDCLGNGTLDQYTPTKPQEA